MKLLSFVLLALILGSCGKAKKMPVTNPPVSNPSITNTDTTPATPTTPNTSTNQINEQRLGTFTIPAPGVMGAGGPTLHFENQYYKLDPTTLSAVMDYINEISNGNIIVQPLSSDSHGSTYQAKFIGSFVKGSCTFNPSSTCTNVSLTFLAIY